MTTELILWGIFISVTSSALYRVMSSLLNSISGKINDYKQVRHLSKLINKYISDISDGDNDEDPRYRKIYEQFEYDLHMFSLSRLSHLSKSKRAQFKLAYSNSATIHFVDKEGYLSLCEEYRKLEWIKKRLK